MRRLKRLLSSHKKEAFIVGFLSLLFITFSITNGLTVAERRAATDNAPPAQTDQTSAQTENRPELTDQQRRAWDTRDESVNKLIKTLCDGIWVNKSANSSIRFSDDGYYTEMTCGQTTIHTYAVTSVDDGTPSSAVVLTADGTSVLTYTPSDKKAKTPASILSDDMFSSSDAEYVKTAIADGVSIEGLDSSVASLVDNKTDDMSQAITDWCAQNYPAVSTATWDKNVVVDWKSSKVAMNFTLDNKVSISVVYDTSAKTFSVSQPR